MPDFLTPAELSARWRVTTRTLANWRSLKKGPPYFKHGAGERQRVLYKMEDVLAWEDEYVRRDHAAQVTNTENP